MEQARFDTVPVGVSTAVSVRRRLAIRWSGIILSCAASALLLHSLLRARDVSANRDAAVAAFAESVGLLLRADAGISPDHVQRACERLVEHRAVVAAAIIDQSGEFIASAAVVAPLIPLLKPGTALGPDIQRQPVAPPDSIARNLPKLEMLRVSLGAHFRQDRPASLCMLVAPERLAPAPGGHVWLFYLPLAAVCGLALALGQKLAKNNVNRPLEQLVEFVRDGNSLLPAPAVCSRRDEWGEVARCVVDLRANLITWKDRTQRDERRFDHQIVTETQRISRHLRKMEREAWVDHLTGLYNRRFLTDRLPTVFAAQWSIDGDLSAIMFDLDEFKRLNDTSGHAAGDELLQFAGELLRQCMRADDLAIRYGGDEFLVVLPGVSAQEAMATAKRIIAMFTQRAKMMFPEAGVSMTAGIASLAHCKPTSPTELIVMADQALYGAKRAGKGGARIHGREPVAA